MIGSRPFYERLECLGLDPAICRLLDNRRLRSDTRLAELSRRLVKSPAIRSYPSLAIYAAGSYARGEASEHSDVDLWFVRDDQNGSVLDAPNIKQIRVTSAVIQEMDDMDFPAPSNDGQYLQVIPLTEVLKHLGGPLDDYHNHFTARMLLLLESSPVYDTDVFNATLAEIIEAYFRDYRDHADDFRPIFLVNDIIRYWKTLCLNYEHRRNQQAEAGKVKQKIKNFKLGYSRLLTCFASVAALCAQKLITKEKLIELCRITPIERLLMVAEMNSDARPFIKSTLESYHWFLSITDKSASDLDIYFSQRENRVIAFQNAREFGDRMFQIIHLVAQDPRTLRSLVI